MKFLALTILMLSFSSAQARTTKMSPIYPSVSLITDVVELEADECVKRIMPGDSSNFQFVVRQASGKAIEGNSSLANFMELTLREANDYDYFRDFVITYSGAVKTNYLNVLIEKNDKTTRKAKASATAKVNPVYNAKADASALSLSAIMPFADEIDYALGGIPNGINSALNNVINTWNNNRDAARRSKQTRANITAGNVTEVRIQAALDLIITAQAMNLLQYSCDKTDVQKQVRELSSYLTRASKALSSVLK